MFYLFGARANTGTRFVPSRLTMRRVSSLLDLSGMGKFLEEEAVNGQTFSLNFCIKKFNNICAKFEISLDEKWLFRLGKLLILMWKMVTYTHIFNYISSLKCSMVFETDKYLKIF